MTWLVVCRSGGDFNLQHAASLRERFINLSSGSGWDFACITDTPKEPWHIPTESKLRGWWSIMESFRFPGPHILTDLDTILVDDILPLLRHAESIEENELWGIHDLAHRGEWASGITAWNGDWSCLYKATTPEMVRTYRGNQELTRSLVKDGCKPGGQLRYLQDEISGIISYKIDIMAKGLSSPPAGTRVCCFHGQPRPWDIGYRTPWIRQMMRLPMITVPE